MNKVLTLKVAIEAIPLWLPRRVQRRYPYSIFSITQVQIILNSSEKKLTKLEISLNLLTKKTK